MHIPIEVKQARRDLEVRSMQARLLTIAWLMLPVLGGGIITGAVMVDPGMLALFIILLPIYGLIAYLSIADDGPYIRRREARWALEDAQDEFAEDLMRADKMNF